MEKRRYLLLDLLRGVAALAVMIYHFNMYFGFEHAFGSSYLAVDLFFCLSGFVLSHVYGEALRTGSLSPTRYMVARFVRLYPLYLFSLLVGAAYYLSKMVLRTPDAPTFGDWSALLALGAAFLPNPDWVVEPAGVFPFEPTAWSLSLEMAVSAAFGVLLFRAGARTLAILGALAAAMLLTEASRRGTVDLGSTWDGFGAGGVRALAALCVGAAVQRIAPTQGRRRAWPFALLSAAALAVLALTPALPVWAAGFCAFGLFPAVLASIPTVEPKRLFAAVCERAGSLSYPVYLLHTPVLLWSGGVVKSVMRKDPATLGFGYGVLLAAVTVVLSWAALRWVDLPARRWLARRLLSRRPASVTPHSASSPAPAVAGP